MAKILNVAAIFLIGMLPVSVLAHSNRQSSKVSIVRGVNYDPNHSLDFSRAVGLNNYDGMVSAIKADLDKLKQLRQFNNDEFKNINQIKTFFSVYASLGPGADMQFVNIADVVHDWNQDNPNYKIKLALGVYEFNTARSSCASKTVCKQWTQAQVNAAINAVKQYGPKLISRIVVGNEDVGNRYYPDMSKRVTHDIRTIQSAINHAVPVGTAQTQKGIQLILSSNHKNMKDLRKTADFIGANIYPFWSKVTYPPFDNSPAKKSFRKSWLTLRQLNKDNKKLIETEEGWPSSASPGWQGKPDYEHDYFYWWYYRDMPTHYVVPVSYYFALFDKEPGKGAESHWGIFSADRHSSILTSYTSSANGGKPLAQGHVVINFVNRVGKGGTSGDGKKIFVTACENDGSKLSTHCYPIYGFAGSGDIKKDDPSISDYPSKAFMVDTTGDTYTSIRAFYYDKNHVGRPLCYISADQLKKLTKSSTVELIWGTGEPNVPCHIRS